jgi:hypothetical protein
MSISPHTDSMLYGKCVPCAANSLELISQGAYLLSYVFGVAAVLAIVYAVVPGQWELLVQGALAAWACLYCWECGESRGEDAIRKLELFEAYRRLPGDPQGILSLKLRL